MQAYRQFGIAVLLFTGVVTALSQPVAERGILDLRGIDYDEYGVVPLNGEWEFYWKQIYEPEDFNSLERGKSADYITFMTPWSKLPQLQDSVHSFGYATLRLKILCDDDLPSLSLYIPEFYTAYDLYVNGEGFEGNGLVGSSAYSSVPNWRPSSKIVELKPGVNELLLHISNFHHHKGGATEAIILGLSDEVNYSRNFKIGSSLFLAGCLLIAGALAFSFYWFKSRDYTGLFFSLFCAAYMYRIIGTEEYVIHAITRSIPWSLTLRLEYISLYASVVFYVYFIRNLIQPRIKLILFHLIAGISAILGILTLFLPTEVFTSFIDYYLGFLGFVITYTGFSYLIHVNLRHKTTYITLTGGIMAFIVVTQKILAYYKVIDENLWLTTIGYFLFISSQAVAMTIRFGRNYRESNAAARMAIKTREQFLNTMSHELRTPMNAILGATELVGKTKLDEEQRNNVDTIKRQSEDLLTIIMDILSLTDAGSTKVVLRKEELNIRECVENAYKLAVKEPHTEVEFIETISTDIPEGIIGDNVRIKQVLVHLLNNAFKFTERGYVSIKVQVLEKTDESTTLHFSIEDTGIGMNKRTLGTIFSIFSQADSENSRRFGGAGIGLNIVEQVLGMMGSSLVVESEPGQGTKVSFAVKFGREARQNTLATLPNYPSEIDTKLRILYAEDNPVNQKLMSMMMKSLGLVIEIAQNGYEAWEMAKSGSYDVILMDVQMPGLDGIEATRKIIKDVKPKPLIIAVTANAETSDKKKCFDAGMNDFINKPIKAINLKEGLLKWQSIKRHVEDGGASESNYIQLSS